LTDFTVDRVRQIKLAGTDVKDKGKAKAVLEDIGEAEPSAGPAKETVRMRLLPKLLKSRGA
jgi:hypothetical protein